MAPLFCVGRMISSWKVVSAILALLMAALVSAAPQQPPLPEFKAGEVLVKFRPEVAEANAEALLQGQGGRTLAQIIRLGVRRVAVPPGRELAIIEALSRNPNVEYAELNYLVYATPLAPPDDPYYASGDQWNLNNTGQTGGTPDADIDAPEAWEITTGTDDIIIAIVDTGVDLNHPDLNAKIVAGYDFVNNDNNAQDDHGHGTHVAGIAAAETNNATGVAGVSWGAKIMPVKVLDRYGYGTYADVAEGILWAAEHGAKVINLSLGGSSPSNTLRNAVRTAYDDYGCIIAAAAGNGYGNGVDYPAVYTRTIAVAATDDDDLWASFSDYGPEVDVAAPGVDVYSTYAIDSYGYLDGTSMATPHVAGLAALVWSVNPNLTNDEVRGIIEDSADDLGTLGRDDYFGEGRINAYQALSATPHLLMVEPSSLYFIADDWLDPPAKSITSPNVSQGAWTVSGPAWVNISGPTGATPSSAEISLNMSQLALLGHGDHVGTLTVSSTISLGVTETVTVTVHYPEALERRFSPLMMRNY